MAARPDPHAPTNRFGLPGALLYQLRTTTDPYSNGKLLVSALRKMQFATWPEFLQHMRNETACPDGRLKGFVKWIEETLPWVAAHERIDPRAVVQIFKECDLFESMFRDVSYNLYTDPRKDAVTNAERCIRNHKLLRRLDSKRNLGGKSVEELLNQEVPIDEDRELIRMVLIETGPGTSGRIDRKVFRAALARRDYNPGKRMPTFRRAMERVFEREIPLPPSLARHEGRDLILDPVVVALWSSLQTAMKLLHAHHRWPVARVMPAQVVASIAKLYQSGQAVSVLTTYEFLEEAGRCSGGRLYRLTLREPHFICEDPPTDPVDAEALWTAVVMTYDNSKLYALPNELSRRHSGRHLLSAHDLNSFQENLMARAKNTTADIEAVRKILLELVAVMQSQFGWPGRNVLPAELINSVLKDPRVHTKVTMASLDSARIIRTVGSLNQRAGFIWQITPDEPEQIDGEATVGEFTERDFTALVRGTFADGQIRAMCDQAKRKLPPAYLVQEEAEPEATDPEGAATEEEAAPGIPKKPTERIGLVATLLGRFHAMLREHREWPHENVLTVVMVRSVAELVYPQMQTDLEFVERVFKALPTYGVIGDRTKMDIAGTPTDVYSLVKTSLDGMENLRTMEIDDDDLLNIIDELLPLVTEEEAGSATEPEALWSPPEFTGKKREIRGLSCNDRVAIESMRMLLRVVVHEFKWPFRLITSQMMKIALRHAHPRSKPQSLQPRGTKYRQKGVLVSVATVWRYQVMALPTDVEIVTHDSYADAKPLTREQALQELQSLFQGKLTCDGFVQDIRQRVEDAILLEWEVVDEGTEDHSDEPEGQVESSSIEETGAAEPEVSEPVLDDAGDASEPSGEPEELEPAAATESEPEREPEAGSVPKEAEQESAVEEVAELEPEPADDSEQEADATDDSAPATEEPVKQTESMVELQDGELEGESDEQAPEPAVDGSQPETEATAQEEQPAPAAPVEVPKLREVPQPRQQPAPAPPRTPMSEQELRLTDLQNLLQRADPAVLSTIFGPMLDPLIDARIDSRLTRVEEVARQAEEDLKEAEAAVERARARAQTARQGADAAKLLRDALRGETPETEKATA